MITNEIRFNKHTTLLGVLIGKVIGEFVCDEILDCRDVNMDDTCLTVEGWLKYTKGHKGVVYGWHISNLVIYDKPRELREFKTLCTDFYDGKHCEECEYFIDGRGYEYDESDCGCDGLKPLKRPPQSWCYVESEVNTE